VNHRRKSLSAAQTLEVMERSGSWDAPHSDFSQNNSGIASGSSQDALPKPNSSNLLVFFAVCRLKKNDPGMTLNIFTFQAN